jgi:hypothetical protein
MASFIMSVNIINNALNGFLDPTNVGILYTKNMVLTGLEAGI